MYSQPQGTCSQWKLINRIDTHRGDEREKYLYKKSVHSRVPNGGKDSLIPGKKRETFKREKKNLKFLRQDPARFSMEERKSGAEFMPDSRSLKGQRDGDNCTVFCSTVRVNGRMASFYRSIESGNGIAGKKGLGIVSGRLQTWGREKFEGKWRVSISFFIFWKCSENGEYHPDVPGGRAGTTSRGLEKMSDYTILWVGEGKRTYITLRPRDRKISFSQRRNDDPTKKNRGGIIITVVTISL